MRGRNTSGQSHLILGHFVGAHGDLVTPKQNTNLQKPIYMPGRPLIDKNSLWSIQSRWSLLRFLMTSIPSYHILGEYCQKSI